MDFKPGVIYGEQLQELYRWANKNKFALPAVNVTSTETINAAMEAAAEANSPIVQFSNGGGLNLAGKSLSNENQEAAILKVFQVQDMFTTLLKSTA